MAYIRVTPQGLVLEEVAPGLTAEDVQRATEARLVVSGGLRVMGTHRVRPSRGQRAEVRFLHERA